MNMVKSHLLSRNTLSSTIIGVIPREPVDEDKVTMWPYCKFRNFGEGFFFSENKNLVKWRDHSDVY